MKTSPGSRSIDYGAHWSTVKAVGDDSSFLTWSWILLAVRHLVSSSAAVALRLNSLCVQRCSSDWLSTPNSPVFTFMMPHTRPQLHDKIHSVDNL